MKIYYIPPKLTQEKKDIQLCSFTHIVTSLFLVNDPVTISIFALVIVLSSYSYYQKNKISKSEIMRAKEDKQLKEYKRDKELQTMRGDKCINVSVKDLL